MIGWGRLFVALACAALGVSVFPWKRDMGLVTALATMAVVFAAAGVVVAVCGD